MRPASLIALASIALTPPVARAQRNYHDQWNSWYALNADVTLSGPWAIIGDASLRRSGPVHQAQANFVRAGIAYAFSEHVRAAVGANYSKAYPFGEVPIAYPVPERRLWEQIVLSHDVGRFDFSHRYRLEHRFRGRRDDPDVDRIDRWERTGRFRYQVRATLPLGAAHTTYVSASNEIFLSFGRHVQTNLFDQDRATLTVGRRVTRNWRTELGFLEHLVFKPNGVDVERNHTLTVSLGYSR